MTRLFWVTKVHLNVGDVTQNYLDVLEDRYENIAGNGTTNTPINIQKD